MYVALQVTGALSTAGEHKKALEQAEKMEQEYVSLMTGQRSVDGSVGRGNGAGDEDGEETAKKVSVRVHVCTMSNILFTQPYTGQAFFHIQATCCKFSS